MTCGGNELCVRGTLLDRSGEPKPAGLAGTGAGWAEDAKPRTDYENLQPGFSKGNHLAALQTSAIPGPLVFQGATRSTNKAAV
jgi:hypothetical protein